MLVSGFFLILSNKFRINYKKKILKLTKINKLKTHSTLKYALFHYFINKNYNTCKFYANKLKFKLFLRRNKKGNEI